MSKEQNDDLKSLNDILENLPVGLGSVVENAICKINDIKTDIENGKELTENQRSIVKQIGFLFDDVYSLIGKSMIHFNDVSYKKHK